jgi:hypothetical protein
VAVLGLPIWGANYKGYKGSPLSLPSFPALDAPLPAVLDSSKQGQMSRIWQAYVTVYERHMLFSYVPHLTFATPVRMAPMWLSRMS